MNPFRLTFSLAKEVKTLLPVSCSSKKKGTSYEKTYWGQPKWPLIPNRIPQDKAIGRT